MPGLPAYYAGLRELPRNWRVVLYVAMGSPFLGVALLELVLALLS